jgi:HlyD family secretion protein
MDEESNLYVFAAEAQEHLKFIKSYLDTVAIAVNSLEPASSSLTLATIEGYRTDISTARTNINTAINNVSGALAALKIAESELAKLQAGSTPEEILIQEASVERARATVANIEAQLYKTLIISPINGVVTRQDAKVGEIITASEPVVSIISQASFQVEANLPESDVSKAKVGNLAMITLDAYGPGINFDAKIISIDPAETVIDGVATYKVTLEFLNEDERIRSGLTANINIETKRKEGVLAIPLRAISNEGSQKIVRVLRADGRADEVSVELGITGKEGRVEIISGLAEGDLVILSRAVE